MTEPAIDVAFRGRLGSFELAAAFAAPARGVTALFGPSGSGKTAVLRCIAGLTHLADGHCNIAGDIWQDGAAFRPAWRRAVGYVFQEASLFPHLLVKANILFGARSAARSHDISFDEVVALLGIEKLLSRAPRNLSGGERQRVAIARALLSQPRLLLMDEPLSALDRQARDEILPFLERLHARLSLPVLYVTHDMSEVEHLADHMVLMASGRVIASGPLASLQSDPKLPLAQSREAAVSLDAIVTGYDARWGLLSLGVEGAQLLAPAVAHEAGTRRRIRIAAGDVSLLVGQRQDSSILNVLPARILAAQATGAHEMIVVLGLGEDGAGAHLLARITHRSWERLNLAVGAPVFAQIKGVSLAHK